VTATKKLFVAAILLAAGFGVARLMGRPDAPWHAPTSGETPVAMRPEAERPRQISSSTPPASAANGTRLVPDFSADNPYRAPANGSALQQLHPSLNEVTVSSAAAAPPLVTSNDQPPRQALQPRAKLRDEAPRPLDFDSRDPATVYTPPTSQSAAATVPPVPDARSAAADWRASGLTPAQFVQDSSSGATINASVSEPPDSVASAATVSPPPWPVQPEADGPRTHVIVDGDSLERLAGRYLDDSARGNEIYEANRELLASPDLLPIGVELVIPKRDSRAELDATSPQSSLATDPSLRAATHGGMVRVRPIPSPSNVLPRAQLLPPARVD
jgi:hypothetical protein